MAHNLKAIDRASQVYDTLTCQNMQFGSFTTLEMKHITVIFVFGMLSMAATSLVARMMQKNP